MKNKVHKSLFVVTCSCGCGTVFEKFDKWGRPRNYVSGHNTPKKYSDKNGAKRDWNHRNRESRYQLKKKRWRSLKVKLIQIFGDKCSDCGREYDGSNASVFHFHHLDHTTKVFAVGNQLCNKAWSDIIVEAQKCVMICANCHELRHGTVY